jgi:hypothetical protein
LLNCTAVIAAIRLSRKLECFTRVIPKNLEKFMYRVLVLRLIYLFAT